jgi:hypothetical protein
MNGGVEILKDRRKVQDITSEDCRVRGQEDRMRDHWSDSIRYQVYQNGHSILASGFFPVAYLRPYDLEYDNKYSKFK